MTVTVFPEGLVLEDPTAHSLLPVITDAFELGPNRIGMPHTLNNAIWLNHYGHKAPSPIGKDYAWPRDKVLIDNPFAHQIVTADFFISNPRDYCLNGIGTGKTLSALWASDYLIAQGYARRVLIVSTLSTLERVWGDALFLHFGHRTFHVLTGSAERRRRLLAQPRDYYIINYDGLVVLKKDLAARSDIDIVILDEVAELSNRKTNAWKAAEAIITPPKPALPKPWVWGMTATPTPNSPEDAYGQCKLVTPTTVPKFFGQWRSMVMDHQSTYVWTPRRESTKIVHAAMQPSIRFKRDDCLDLPPVIYQTRQAELSDDQLKHYKAVAKECKTEIQGGRVTALNEGIKISKLMQIACGVVYDSDGKPREIDAKARINLLCELIEQVDEKVIVFVPFTAVTSMLARELNKHWNFAIVTGETPHKERNRVFGEFQNPDIDMDIVAHPECMAHGLTLTEASTIIWYAPVASNRIYEQANGRITRPGQKYTANIIHMCGSTVERRAYKRLEDRQSMQGLLLSMYEAGEL